VTTVTGTPRYRPGRVVLSCTEASITNRADDT
jgi:hypothetical protein